jgi:hypothetical protein
MLPTKMDGSCSVLSVVTSTGLYPQTCLSHGPAMFGICTQNILKDVFPTEGLHCSLILCEDLTVLQYL